MSSPTKGFLPIERFPADVFFTGSRQRSSDEEATAVSEGQDGHDGKDWIDGPREERSPPEIINKRLRLETGTSRCPEGSIRSHRSILSPSQTREQAHRLDDELKIIQVEQQVEREAARARAEEAQANVDNSAASQELRREPSHRDQNFDEFDVATNPIHERTAIYNPPARPTTVVAKFVKRLHKKSFLIRYVTYITPVVLIILIPLLIGALVPLAQDADVGGVELLWFCIWLLIVWLTLWAGRILAKAMPHPIGLISSLFTDNSKKWRDMAQQLEVSGTLFFWWLGIEISFLPTMKNHHVDGNRATRPWESTLNKILVSCLVAAVLNFAEKIIIQLIAISFHQRTYSDRIELNKFQIGSLTKLYTFSRAKLTQDDSDFEARPMTGPGSGARTPGVYLEKAQRGTTKVFRNIGDVAGKIAGDFTGRQVKQSSHPSQVVLALLNTTSGSQVLARRLYRTFASDETETIHQDALRNGFENDEEADAAFTMFDKDLNGDISMEELESVCVEIGRERKSITASLKDLDSVVGKLDNVLMYIVFVIFVLVLISLISTSAAGVLTSAGSTILALSWLLQATAQEFLQSLIFVFVKHPFDVGDRITIYGNTGVALKGDDYFVKEISLLYTEFKKMEGHVVQAPNSYLNTLFILNQRRSGGLAEAVPMTWKFGTTVAQIDELRAKLLEFVEAEKREFQGNVLTEVRDIVEAHAISVNVIFFFKSSWQNEGLRLQRRNKFICALMVAMQEVGIEGPRMRYAGQKETFPLYMQNIPFSQDHLGHGGTPDNPAGIGLPSVAEAEEQEELRHQQEEPSPRFATQSRSRVRGESIASRPRGESGVYNQTPISDLSFTRRVRGQSIAAMNFSSGIEGNSSADYAGDVYADRKPKARIPINVTSPSQSRTRSSNERRPSVMSSDMARTTSRTATFAPSMSQRSGTGGDRVGDGGRTSSIGSLHRNHFFGNGNRTSHESVRMELGMAGIPEGDSTPAQRSFVVYPADGVTDENVGAQETFNQRMDPRPGFVSPRPTRDDTNEEGLSGARFEMMRRLDGNELFRASPLGLGRVGTGGSGLPPEQAVDFTETKETMRRE